MNLFFQLCVQWLCPNGVWFFTKLVRVTLLTFGLWFRWMLFWISSQLPVAISNNPGRGPVFRIREFRDGYFGYEIKQSQLKYSHFCLFVCLQFDLEWVQENWSTEGCDLWEEVRSNDFYFNRMAYLYSLNVAADFGDMIGQSGGDVYRKLAETIKVGW